MGTPQRESYRADKSYKKVLYIDGRDAQDFSFNEQQDITDAERARLGNAVFKDGGIVEGLQPEPPDGVLGNLVISDGHVWVNGYVEPIAGATLSYTPAKVSGIDTVYLRWLMDQITISEDSTLKSPSTGDVIDERIRVRATLANANPDALDEAFERWDGTVPRNWNLASGSCNKGYPSKFGEQGVLLQHTFGLETRIEKTIALTPSTGYRVYFWVRTAPGYTDLATANGAYVRFSRTLPAYNPADYIFATTSQYVRNSFLVTSDGNSDSVTFAIVIPAAAPTTQVLVDAILVTTEALGSLDMDRHYVPLMFWDRATDKVTRAITRVSNIRMTDLEPPLDGRDIVNLDLNSTLLDLLASMLFDENGHFRVPPGLTVARDTSTDDSGHLGLIVAPGRAYVSGYRVDKPSTTALLVDKALDTAAVADEGHTFAFGTDLYTLNKAAVPTSFPIADITGVTAQVEKVVSITRGGVGGGADLTGLTNVTSIQAVTQGHEASLVGSNAGPFAFTEANNVFKLTVSNYDGTAGAEQTIRFAVGTYTLAEVLEALLRGSGRAYRSGKIVGNVTFSNDGTGKLKVATKTKSASASLVIGGASSTANAVFGFTNGQAAVDASGTQYVVATDYVQSGNSVDWSPGGAEPIAGTTYTVVCRVQQPLVQATDYLLGGVFNATATKKYKVAAVGANGEGLPSSLVSIAIVAGNIVTVSWTSVVNAVSYNVYRSDDGGATYNFLFNLTGTSFTDDGSMTPDATRHPSALAATTSGSVGVGSTSVTVDSTAGFASSGKAYLGGSDEFTYTSVDATHFLGVAAIGQTWAGGTQVTAAPAMGSPTATLSNQGVLNLTPQGSEPVDGSVVEVSYEYYMPRIDRIVIARDGTVSVIRGVPFDAPEPPAKPVSVLELAQVRPDPAAATGTITNLTMIDRTTMSDIQLLRDRVNTLYQNDITQTIFNQVANKTTTAKKGMFADGMATFDAEDPTHPDFAGLLERASRYFTVPFIMSRPTLTPNGGTTTAQSRKNMWQLPSTEVAVFTQGQWSDTMQVNPYSAFTPPPPRIALNPNQMSWTVGSNAAEWEAQANAAAALIVTQQNRMPGISHHINVAEAVIAQAQEIVRQAQQVTSGAVTLEQVTILVNGVDFGPNEDNIAGTFASVAVNLTGVDGTAAGTNPGTVKADGTGRWSATFTVPTGIAAGTHDFIAKGGVSTASAAFTGLASVYPPPPPLPGLYWDPLAQSFIPDVDTLVTGFSAYFAKKDSGSVPITCELRTMADGVPTSVVLAKKALAPSEVSVGGAETKFDFDRDILVEAGTPVAFCLLTVSNAYSVQIATLGRVGQNPVAWINSNPYEKGVLFSSSNAQSWTIHQTSDMRFKVYGRNYSGSGVLEFTTIAGVDFSDIFVGADQTVPRGTTVTWEYELNGDNYIRKLEPFSKRALDVEGTSIIVRARFATTNSRVSPLIVAPTIGLVGFLNATAGKYISAMKSFDQGLASAHIYVRASIPSACSITWYASNDDGATWEATALDSSAAFDETFTDYNLSLTFADNTQKKFRLRGDLVAASPLVYPIIRQIGVTLE